MTYRLIISPLSLFLAAVVAGQCLCTNSSCAYKDTAVPVAKNGTNGTTSSTGAASGNKPSAASTMTPVYGVLIASVVVGLTGLLL